MPEFECPYCFSEITAPGDADDHSFHCPRCDGEIRMSSSGQARAVGAARRSGGTGSSRGQSGMVQQVKVVAILMIIQGSLELVLGLVGGIGGSVMVQVEPQGAPPVAVFIVLGLVMSGIGASRLLAGIMNLKFRGRIFGIVTHCVGFLTACTGYCAPTAIGLAIYGMIVYLNHDVADAFEQSDERLQSARDRYEN